MQRCVEQQQQGNCNGQGNGQQGGQLQPAPGNFQQDVLPRAGAAVNVSRTPAPKRRLEQSEGRRENKAPAFGSPIELPAQEAARSPPHKKPRRDEAARLSPGVHQYPRAGASGQGSLPQAAAFQQPAAHSTLQAAAPVVDAGAPASPAAKQQGSPARRTQHKGQPKAAKGAAAAKPAAQRQRAKPAAKKAGTAAQGSAPSGVSQGAAARSCRIFQGAYAAPTSSCAAPLRPRSRAPPPLTIDATGALALSPGPAFASSPCMQHVAPASAVCVPWGQQTLASPLGDACMSQGVSLKS